MPTSHPRLTLCALTAVVLVIASVALHPVQWLGDDFGHALMEWTAVCLALAVSGLALLHNRVKGSPVSLFLGFGFFATALLDAYHVFATSQHFASTLEALSHWSWSASRLFLAQYLFVIYVLLRRAAQSTDTGAPSSSTALLSAADLALVNVFFFTFFDLPPAQLDDSLLSRPGELAPALFFALALFGYVRAGGWRTSALEYWLVLSLVVGIGAQAAFMALSQQPFDAMFGAAHVLKILSYGLVLCGLSVALGQREAVSTGSAEPNEPTEPGGPAEPAEPSGPADSVHLDELKVARLEMEEARMMAEEARAMANAAQQTKNQIGRAHV